MEVTQPSGVFDGFCCCAFLFFPQQDEGKETSERFCLFTSYKRAEELKLCVSVYKNENTASVESVLSKSNFVCMLITSKRAIYIQQQKSRAGGYRLL